VAVEFGAFRYLIKPIHPASLVDLVGQAAEAHDVARRKRQALERDDQTRGDRVALEGEFAAGLCKMRLAFQPIVSWSKRKVFAYEALLRSDEPTMASPLAFLEAAASLGKLHDLGRAVRARAGMTPQSDGALTFVNLHACDLNDEDLYDPSSPLAQIAGRVVLELTEQVSLEQVTDVPRCLARLRKMGFRVALDDVGAGYAGLTSLSVIRPELAKIDMGLVRNIDTDAAKRCVVGSVFTMCAELGIAVVAEGVETTAERDTLLALGGDLLQGYLFGKPGAAGSMATF
jgi:EAL domain-containing protein (putative c-di-GMP-specific phosphodiesterase class I)